MSHNLSPLGFRKTPLPVNCRCANGSRSLVDGTVQPFGQGPVGRLALAPSPGGGIRASNIWEESPIVEQLERERPYGEYWMLLEQES